ncbi:hypothetical protein ACROYT_G040491 [Oculina patagonica]
MIQNKPVKWTPESEGSPDEQMRPEFNKLENGPAMDAQLVSLADKSVIFRQAVQNEEIQVTVRKINHNRGHKDQVILTSTPLIQKLSLMIHSQNLKKQIWCAIRHPPPIYNRQTTEFLTDPDTKFNIVHGIPNPSPFSVIPECDSTVETNDDQVPRTASVANSSPVPTQDSSSQDHQTELEAVHTSCLPTTGIRDFKIPGRLTSRTVEFREEDWADVDVLGGNFQR